MLYKCISKGCDSPSLQPNSLCYSHAKDTIDSGVGCNDDKCTRFATHNGKVCNIHSEDDGESEEWKPKEKSEKKETANSGIRTCEKCKKELPEWLFGNCEFNETKNTKKVPENECLKCRKMYIQCGGITKKNIRCVHSASTNNGYCYTHDRIMREKKEKIKKMNEDMKGEKNTNENKTDEPSKEQNEEQKENNETQEEHLPSKKEKKETNGENEVKNKCKSHLKYDFNSTCSRKAKKGEEFCSQHIKEPHLNKCEYIGCKHSTKGKGKYCEIHDFDSSRNLCSCGIYLKSFYNTLCDECKKSKCSYFGCSKPTTGNNKCSDHQPCLEKYCYNCVSNDSFCRDRKKCEFHQPCSEVGCKKFAETNSDKCNYHYKTQSKCSVPGCTLNVYINGKCGFHFMTSSHLFTCSTFGCKNLPQINGKCYQCSVLKLLFCKTCNCERQINEDLCSVCGSNPTAASRINLIVFSDSNLSVKYGFLSTVKKLQMAEALTTYGFNIKAVITITKDSLNKLYREKSRIHHPDKGGNQETFKKILSDKEMIESFIAVA